MLIPRASLVIRDRQRSKIATSPLNELKMMILERGLQNAPMCFPLGGSPAQWLLIAGERRTKAIDLIAAEGKSFKHNAEEIAPGFLPITITDLATPVEHKEAELDENIGREELSWQDRAQALSDIHSLKLLANPEQTVLQTSRELAAQGGLDGAKSPEYIKRAIRESTLIAQHLDNPAIANARNASEAHTLILKHEEERVNAALARKRIAQLPERPLIEVRHGDAHSVLPLLDPGAFDLICADPPYGIDAGAGGFRSRTVHHHNYEDTVEVARALAQLILTEGFRLTKPRANLFLFTDVKHWDWLQRISAQIGWTPFPRPLIWGKSDSEGLAPWGSQGPRITTEFILFATKGQRGLLASPIDYLRVNRVPRHERIHAAEKPVELVRRLIECSTLPGDRVLDPCCGSGSTLIACRESGRTALGIEKDSTYYNTAMSNVYIKERPNGNGSGADPVQGTGLPDQLGQAEAVHSGVDNSS